MGTHSDPANSGMVEVCLLIVEMASFRNSGYNFINVPTVGIDPFLWNPYCSIRVRTYSTFSSNL
jgi:hypothetical protein